MFSAFSQSEMEFEFLPDSLHFLPLRGNPQEAKMGVLWFPSNNNLKVDIGNSIDILGFYYPSSNTKITVGTEFMAYGLVTSYQQHQLQIDALDGFFGGNLTYSKKYEKNIMYSRFRFIHHSAHLADGHWDSYEGKWMDSEVPIGFGRDYFELLIGMHQSDNFLSYRYYGSGSYSITQFTRHKPLSRLSGGLGIEAHKPSFPGNILGQKSNLFFTGHLNIIKTSSILINQTYLAGIKFGEWDGKGILFYFSYYSGGDIFSQFFTERVNRFGFGLSLDFM